MEDVKQETTSETSETNETQDTNKDLPKDGGENPQEDITFKNEIKQEVGKMLLDFEDRIISLLTNKNSETTEEKDDVKKLDF